MFLVMLASILIAGLWSYIPIIKEITHTILDPSVGFLLNWNIYFGMFFVVFVISLGMTLAQKYLTDQETLRKMKEEQKLAKEEMKKYKNEPEKLLELNKKQMEKMPQMFEITARPLLYTFIPIVLFFRWFSDFFSSSSLTSFKFFGFLSWFWFYLIFSIIFSSILRKALNVA